MERNYCLNSWKEIDYDALEAKYLPMIQEAEKTGDKATYGKALEEFAYEFHDGHVSINLLDEDLENATEEALYGNDYGLSLFTLSDGTTIAVNVETDEDTFKIYSAETVNSENGSESGTLNSASIQESDGIPGLQVLSNAGIKNGTVITKWDGRDIASAVADVQCVDLNLQYPVKENEDLLRPIFLAGKGGDTVDVTYLDEKGKEKTVTLPKQGTYYSRLYITEAQLFQQKDAFIVAKAFQEKSYDQMSDQEKTNLKSQLKEVRENFATKMITDKCGYLRLNKEGYDDRQDNIAVLRHGYYPSLTEMYNKKLEDLQDQGMEYLVIDLRNNTGGYDCVAGALASLFTDEKQYLAGFGRETSRGKKQTNADEQTASANQTSSATQSSYKLKESEYIFPDGRWKDLPVVVLTNQTCMSAGDCAADVLGRQDNVTLMGISPSNGVNQNNDGTIYLTDCAVCINYPSCLTLSEDAVPYIDTDVTRTNRIPLEETIPVDKEAAMTIFSGKDEDYELEYAVEYLENN